MSNSAEHFSSLGVVKSLGQLGIVVTGVLVPTMTSIKGCHESRMVEQQQNHQIRMSYFEKAVDEDLGLSFHQKVMRFLIIAAPDNAVREWATGELEILNRDKKSHDEKFEPLCSLQHQITRQLELISDAIAEGQTQENIGAFRYDLQDLRDQRLTVISGLDEVDYYVFLDLLERLKFCSRCDAESSNPCNSGD